MHKSWSKNLTAIRLFLLSVCLMSITACGESEFEYSSKRIHFIFENGTHLNANLASAMSPHSNVFATIQQVDKVVGGSRVSYIAVKSSQSTQVAENKLNAVDLKRTIILGYRNGIIVGYGNLSDPLTFFAYDLECPNCFNPTAIPIKDYYLTVSNLNKAHCATCQREYDLNNGGIITAGDKGEKLTRYRAHTTGAYGVLTVN